MSALLAILLLSGQAAAPGTLFDGKTLAGWHADVPDNDGKADAKSPFTVRDGMLVSLGTPMGHLITDASYENYRLIVEYRYVKEAGNCGVIVHVSTPRFRGFLPKGIECQLRSGNAGDFHMFGESIKPRDEKVQATPGRVPNLTDNSEKPIGDWNTMRIECRGNTIQVWVNGDFVNDGVDASVAKGQIALQSEGAEVEFRKLELTKLTP